MSESQSIGREIKDPNTTQWRCVPVRHTAMLVKVLPWLDSTSAKELEGEFLQVVGSDTNLWRPWFNRTLIMHANVYDQDQGLTGRYHNTTKKIK